MLSTEFDLRLQLDALDVLYHYATKTKKEERHKPNRPSCPITPEEFLNLRCQALAEIRQVDNRNDPL